MILDAFIPGAGWSSYIVTIGPGDIFIISPSILKSASTFFSISELALSSCSLIRGELFLSGCERKSTDGVLYSSSSRSISFCNGVLISLTLVWPKLLTGSFFIPSKSILGSINSCFWFIEYDFE